ncbi:uncharacterized protein LOC134851546 [Symsagittifera roscoffensis]|uniref:uncharacterized protein LOC134851546 n=1 Tax=Symsagittifera roscoffensis TaxID=84072 RepID=UPI00307BC3F8
MPGKRLEKWGYCCGTITRDRFITIYPEQILDYGQLQKWYDKHSGYITAWEKTPRPKGGISRIFMGEGIRVILNDELEEKLVVERMVFDNWLLTGILRPETEISVDNETAQQEPPSFLDKFIKSHHFSCPVHDTQIEKSMKTTDSLSGEVTSKEFMQFPVRDGYCDPDCTKHNVKCQHYDFTVT